MNPALPKIGWPYIYLLGNKVIYMIQGEPKLSFSLSITRKGRAG